MSKNSEEILKELNAIFCEVLDNDEIVLTSEMTSADVEEWDSLAHIQLTLAIGRHFNIKFTTEEIVSWVNVGSIVDSVIKHLEK